MEDVSMWEVDREIIVRRLTIDCNWRPIDSKRRSQQSANYLLVLSLTPITLSSVLNNRCLVACCFSIRTAQFRIFAQWIVIATHSIASTFRCPSLCRDVEKVLRPQVGILKDSSGCRRDLQSCSNAGKKRNNLCRSQTNEPPRNWSVNHHRSHRIHKESWRTAKIFVIQKLLKKIFEKMGWKMRNPPQESTQIDGNP